MILSKVGRRPVGLLRLQPEGRSGAHQGEVRRHVRAAGDDDDQLAGHAAPAKANLVIAWERTKVPIEIDTDVVAKIKPQIEAAMAGSGEKPYFAAAMFYYENDLDMTLAKEWIEAAVKKQPDAVWMVYRKGLILKKAGDKEARWRPPSKRASSHRKQEGEVKAEYTRLSESLIASLK